MSAAMLLLFDSPNGATWIDPLEVASLEGAINIQGGTRLRLTAGGLHELDANPESAASRINDARTAFAQARRDGREGTETI